MEFRTTGFSGYAVKYSPFVDSRLAVAAAKNFGLVGNGRVYVLRLTPQGIQPEQMYDTQDACYDIAFSERNPDHVVVACGDGSIQMFDAKIPQHPIMSWREHTREAYAVCWNLVTKESFVSSSWDGTIKVWSPERPQSMISLPTHSCTYSTAFSPHSPSIISSVTSDSHLRIFDLRTQASASNHLVKLIPIHGSAPVPGQPHSGQPIYPPSEALTHDWNKYRDTVVAVAGVDSRIRTFDLRNTRSPVAVLEGHGYAVRRVAWSPHISDVLLSASYDMSIRVWTDGTSTPQPGLAPSTQGQGSGSQIGQMDHHTEFCTGVDWCLFGAEGWVASTAWDQRVCVWDVRNFMGS